MSKNNSQIDLKSVRKTRFEDKKEMSGRIGETSRFIGFGIVALVFTIHGSDNAFAQSIVCNSEVLLNIVGLAACLALLSDYLQYVCGYISVNHALTRDENNFDYDTNTIAYRGRSAFFWLKQVFAFGGAIGVIGIITLEIFRS